MSGRVVGPEPEDRQLWFAAQPVLDAHQLPRWCPEHAQDECPGCGQEWPCARRRLAVRAVELSQMNLAAVWLSHEPEVTHLLNELCKSEPEPVPHRDRRGDESERREGERR